VRRALVLVMLIAACDSPVKPYEPQLNVYCVLRTDDSHPLALVGRSVSYEDWNRGHDWNGIADATVVIAEGSDSTRFTSMPDSSGCYAAESLRACAGKSYGLFVRSPDGNEVHGWTTVPGSFAIDSVNTAADSGQLLVRIVWSSSQGATGYELLVSSYYIEADGDTFCHRQSESSDSSTALLLTSLYWNGVALAAIEFNVAALDRNYKDYLTMQSVYGYRNTLMHLDGGLGVFGSVCVAETTVYLRQLTRSQSTRPSQ
jgi:hypothetical protein